MKAKSFFEQSASGRILEWRQHPFSGSLPHHWLQYEPIYRRESVMRQHSLRLQIDLSEIRWHWQGWTRVDLDDGENPIAQYERSSNNETKDSSFFVVPWSHLMDVDRIEVTPVRTHSEGMTQLVIRPAPEVVFEHYGPPGRRWVRLSVGQRELAKSFQIQLLETEIGDQLSPVGSAIGWGADARRSVAIPARFHGYLVVYRHSTHGPRVIAARTFADGGLRTRIAEHGFSQLELAVNGEGGTEPRFAEWPERSRALLLQLVDRADFGSTGDELLEWARSSPTSLFRLLMLEQVSRLPEKIDVQAVRRRLNAKKDLLEDLATLWPALSEISSRFDRPELQLRFLQYIDHPRLDRLLQRVHKDATVDAFDKALARIG